jgi:hypothetical protein
MPFESNTAEIHYLATELARLREEHSDLDLAIDALEKMAQVNQIQIQRLKKRKLFLKDQISVLEDRLMPDIIA